MTLSLRVFLYLKYHFTNMPFTSSGRRPVFKVQQVAPPCRRTAELIAPRLAVGIGRIVFHAEISIGERRVAVHAEAGNPRGFQPHKGLRGGHRVLLQDEAVVKAGLRRYSVDCHR